jgi:hypothetical protein
MDARISLGNVPSAPRSSSNVKSSSSTESAKASTPKQSETAASLDKNDRIDLSEASRRLAEALRSEKDAIEAKRQSEEAQDLSEPQEVSKADAEGTELEPFTYPKPFERTPSQWQQERLARLDRVETLIKQGQYKVDPFMVDELAVVLARNMV